jgi:hypothetical protein
MPDSAEQLASRLLALYRDTEDTCRVLREAVALSAATPGAGTAAGAQPARVYSALDRAAESIARAEASARAAAERVAAARAGLTHNTPA